MSDIPNSIREVGESKFIKLMLFAQWGVGKTVFVGSSGPRSLILRPPIDHTDSIISHYMPAQRPKEWVLHDWDEANMAWEYVRLHGGEWDWIWLDSISLFQEIGLDDIWQATIAHNPNRNLKHAGKDKGEYGRNMDRLSEWVRNVVSLDTFNFGITAFPTMKFEAPGGDERKMMPWVQGKMMSEKICGYMNMVGYMEVIQSKSNGKVYRRITFRETDDYYGKDQFNAFPNHRVVDPTVPKLTAAVAAARGKTPVRGKRKVASVPKGRTR